MKPGWAFLLLALVVLAGFSLNIGIFVGSEIVKDDYWKKRCNYLFPSGITTILKGGWNTRAEAENELCRLFHG